MSKSRAADPSERTVKERADSWRGTWKERVFIAFVLLAILGVVTYRLDLTYGSSVYTTCKVLGKSHSSGGKGGRARWELDVKCPESRESASASEAYWKKRKRGDAVTIEIRTSWLFGFREATAREDERATP